MHRHEAAAKVNDALRAAGTAEKILDPKVKSITIDLDGRAATLEFKHGTHALEHRKDDLARFRAGLVEELLAEAPKTLAPAPEATPATEQPEAAKN